MEYEKDCRVQASAMNHLGPRNPYTDFLRFSVWFDISSEAYQQLVSLKHDAVRQTLRERVNVLPNDRTLACQDLNLNL
jgi:predicted ATPase